DRPSWFAPVGGTVRQGSVEVLRSLRVAGHERLVRRLIRGEGRACAQWRLRGVREQAQTPARREPNGGRRPRAQRLPPRLDHETRRLAIAVEGLTKASAAHQRVEEFLVGF